jgi:hypothetical protein
MKILATYKGGARVAETVEKLGLEIGEQYEVTGLRT